MPTLFKSYTMMKINLQTFIKNLVLLIMVIMIFTECHNSKTKVNEMNPEQILINQVGFVANMPKTALSKIKTNKFFVIDTTGNQVYEGHPSGLKYWNCSGDSVCKLDFSSFKTNGIYHIKLNDTIISYPFVISPTPYTELNKAAIKSYYLNRSGFEITKEFGGNWARLAGHPDTAVMIHESTADKKRPAGIIISSPGGWYDAGDYNKYIVNSSITTYTLLRALEDNIEYYKNLNLNIPESDDDLPDLLNEILFNLNWVITMQDPNDGGVYHKLTTKNFEGFVMPHEATAQRYVVQKTTAATLDYAALLSYAARVLELVAPIEYGTLIKSCQKKSKYAWEWALKHPDVVYQQPKDIRTGTYGDPYLNDEWFWAASELFISTLDKNYLKILNDKYRRFKVPTWDSVGILGTISLLSASEIIKDYEDQVGLKTKKDDFFHIADSLLNSESNSAYQIGIKHFAWGSNSDVANDGFISTVAYKLSGDIKYKNSALNDLDYLLGRNATGYCFVTGYGFKSPMNIHHRPSGSDTVAAPYPGFLVGGPNLVVLTDCGDTSLRSSFPAKSYLDKQCSYSTNEIAINWNAPLIYILSGVSAQ